MGTACTSCCEPARNRDNEFDLSNRKIPFEEPKTTPNSAEAEIRRHESRDSAREDSKNQLSRKDSSRQHVEKPGAGHSKLKPSSGQNAGGLNIAPPPLAQRDGSNSDILKEKGTMGAELSNIRSAVQNSKLSDPQFQSHQVNSNPRENPFIQEGPIINRVKIEKPQGHHGRTEEQDNTSDLNSVTNNGFELPGLVAAKDQRNYIVVMKADQSKNMSEDREHNHSRSDCKSIEKALDDVKTPHGNAAYRLGLGQGAHLMPSRSGITVVDDVNSGTRSGKQADPQGYLFSQETANNKLDNSILRSRYDLANYPSGRTIDVPDEGKTKEILKIMSYEQLTDIKVFTEKRYHKTLVQLYAAAHPAKTSTTARSTSSSTLHLSSSASTWS